MDWRKIQISALSECTVMGAGQNEPSDGRWAEVIVISRKSSVIGQGLRGFNACYLHSFTTTSK